ncbi:MAG: NAD kinase [Actinobacteria bacterium]|uniref:NAD kinase n=1 Tax=Nostocoides veronense TaxID=330836 RepID=A0ABN2L8U3_9MICO|nr:NAD kinase [Actinomycetota bacterium]
MSGARRILVVVHPRRPDAASLAAEVIARLDAAGVTVLLDPLSADVLDPGTRALVHLATGPDPAAGCELVLVLGGDGTILRGAEWSRSAHAPLLGVNLGHVGFLAETEREHAHASIDRILDRDYAVTERMTLDVIAHVDGVEVARTFALNEATVEKAARERMLELTVEIDGRPISTWGCDGVVMATPTGSTAYAFSAGGPVIWPDVEAMLVVPISAHALFSRPMVLSPRSLLAVDIVAGTEGHGALWCDGRRAVDLPAGARVEVCRGAHPVLLARLIDQPFTDRLVEKFGLSVHGWRGSRAADSP